MIKTPAHSAEAEITEKKSRFIALCAPVSTEAEARALIAGIRKRHYDARHHCYAYRVEGIERGGDDGEPSGTAGAPILAALRGAGLTDACCVVTRYFGGTLLGTGGLTRAYGAAAGAAIAGAGVETRQAATGYTIALPYPYEARARAALSSYTVTDTAYTDKVMFTALIPEGEEARFMAAITDAAYGDCTVTEIGKGHIKNVGAF